MKHALFVLDLISSRPGWIYLQKGTIRRFLLFCSILFSLTIYVTATMRERSVVLILQGDAYYSLLTSHSVSEAPEVARLLGEPRAEHAARAASPHHPPPARIDTFVSV